MACVLLAYVGLDLFARYQDILLGRFGWQNHVQSAARRQRSAVISVTTSTVRIMQLNALHAEL
jgi:hypothetical protein